jgi:hypothetical protein
VGVFPPNGWPTLVVGHPFIFFFFEIWLAKPHLALGVLELLPLDRKEILPVYRG